jgi:hypothetical protein
VRAADQASAALAFDRATRLYRLSLQLSHGDPSTPARRAKLANALEQAGRGAESAQAYLEAAEGQSEEVELDLRRRAAEQFLRSGHVAEGMEALERVLGAVGLKLAPTPARALTSLLVRRTQLRLRGLEFHEHDASQLSAEELRRIDVCWSVAVPLGMVDTIRAADVQTRHVLLALAAGEPYRVARALAVEASFAAGPGGPSRHRAAQLVAASRRLAERLDNPHALGLSSLMAGVAGFLGGRWGDALGDCEHAAQVLGERCTGVAWELHNAHFFGLCALTMLGELAEVQRRVPPLRRAAEERGDLYAGGTLRVGLISLCTLAADQPARAREETVEAMRPWAGRHFQLQHYSQLVAEVHTDLYLGDGEAALGRMIKLWPSLRRALLLRTQFFRVEAHDLRARSALAFAARHEVGSVERARLLDAAEADAARVEREHMPWARPIGLLLRAGIAQLRGQTALATPLVAETERGFQAASMALHAAAARRRRGELLGHTDGDGLVAAADAWMVGQQIRNPRRMTALIAPGLG